MSRTSATSFEQILQARLEEGEARAAFFPTRRSLNACLGTCANGVEDKIDPQRLRRASLLKKLAIYLQIFYEKSGLRHFFPLIILVAYSLLGGFIFYTIESPEEQKTLLKKKEYLEEEQGAILMEILGIQQRIQSIYHFHNSTETRNVEIYNYRSFAMNRLNKAIYWYALQVYYLNDQESYKTSLLHPTNPERIWRTHFTSNFGRIFALKNYTQQLSDRCWEIGVEMNDLSVAKHKLEGAMKLFNDWTGLHHVLTPTWTFWNSMFLAVTTYTTIGYGNVTAKSQLGKLAAMIYAVVGIPLVLMILHRLGHTFLLLLQNVWDKCIWMMELVSCVKNADKLRGRLLDEERESGMPVWLAIGIAGGWMFLCSAIFLKFEKDWDYFKSFYFFFCSLTTIGYGDVTPTNSEDMFIIFGFIIIGLSLVSMCINVVQMKLENLFEEFLMAVLEEYGSDQASVIIDAENIREKFGVFDLWKLWKKKKKKQARQRREQSILVNAATADGPVDKLDERRRSSRVYRLPDLRELKKIFPFMAKRRREVLLQQFHTKLHQLHKATQTEGPPPVYYHEVIKPLSVAQEVEEEEIEISARISDQTNNDLSSFPSLSVPAMDTSRSSSSPPKSLSSGSRSAHSWPENNKSVHKCQVLINEGSSSSSSYARRYLPSRSERRATPTSACSAHSAPNVNPGPSSGGPDPSYYTGRRWTFFEIGKTPRGAPRGLVIPYMYMKRTAKTHETTEMKRLISELDARLLQCRTLISPCSRSVSRASRVTSVSNSSQASSLRNITPLSKDSSH